MVYEGVSVVICKRVCAVLAERQRGGLGTYKPQKYQIDQSRCTGCGTCVERLGCPSIIQVEKKGLPSIDQTTCFGCGVCGLTCPTEAIRRMP